MKKILILFSVILSLVGPLTSRADADPLTGVVLGVVLDRFSDRLESIVSHAGGQARSAVITAAGEANNLVNNARVAYKDSLTQTIQEGNNTIFASIQGIDGAITKIESDTDSDVQRAITQIQQIALVLPVNSKEPQINGQIPRITTVAGDNAFLLKISGIFYYAKDNGYRPFLLIGDKRVDPQEIITNELIFSVQKSDLKQSGNSMSVTRLDLRIPYKPQCFFCISKQEANFSIIVGILPEKAGHITVSARHYIENEESKTVTSSGIGLSSEHCCDKEEDVCDPAEIPAGWRYVANSATMVNLHEIGGSSKGHDWDEKGPRVSTHVCWHVITWQHHHGTDGNVDFQIKYQIARTNRNSNDDVVANSDVKWGDTKAVALPEETSDWVVTYMSFDGKTKLELSQPGSTVPPFVTVGRASANTLQISVAPPTEF